MKRILLTLLLVGLGLAGCEETVTAPEGPVFVVEVVPGETFRVLIQDEVKIAQARALLASGEATVVHGELVRGSGGFNAGFSWHLAPATVTFVDLTMELCDGRPSYVESELDYYLDSVRFYCPWGATIVAEE